MLYPDPCYNEPCYKEVEVYQDCSNDDPELTLIYFTARSNLIPYMLLYGKKVKQLIFQKLHRRKTFKFGLETTLSIQESSKVNLVQSLSNQ